MSATDVNDRDSAPDPPERLCMHFTLMLRMGGYWSSNCILVRARHDIWGN